MFLHLKMDWLRGKTGKCCNLQNNLPQVKYNVVTDYSVTFNKIILSTIVSLMAFVDNEGPKYNSLNNYNFDLLTK